MHSHASIPAPGLARVDPLDYRGPDPAGSPGLMPRPDRRALWRGLVLAMTPLAGLYLLLLNGVWLPGGDSEVYLVIARNLLSGRGYTFNGEVVGMVPPGWPIVLAGVLAISPYMLAVKLTLIACMLASLAMAYLVLTRFVSVGLAALIVILTGILHPLYPLTYWAHSEALFCLTGWAILLIAVRARERRAGYLELTLLVLLCAAAVTVRWTGLIHILIAGALLLSHGHWRRWSAWVLLTLMTLATVGAFVATQQALRLTDEQARRAQAVGGGADIDATDPSGVRQPLPPINAEAQSIEQIVREPTRSAEQTVFERYQRRLIGAGRWYAWLLWYPMRFGQSVPALDLVAKVAGWTTIALLSTALLVYTRRGQLVWVALAIYTGALCMNWPNPNARYFVPVAPLLLLGVFQSLLWFKQLGWRRLGRLGGAALVGSVLLANVPLLLIDIVVLRGDDPISRFEAGAHASLIRNTHYLMSLDPPAADEQIGVSERYVNLGRARFSKAGLRSVVFVSDRVVRPVPPSLSQRPTPELTRWAGRRTAYYLFQQPSNPWRVWHFTLTPELQALLTGAEIDRVETGGWELYQFRRAERRWKRLEVPEDLPVQIRRIPGL